MRLAHIVPSLDDRHGGPSRSVRAVADALVRAGEDCTLLTTAEPSAPAPLAGPAPIHVFARQFPRSLGRSTDLARHLAGTPYECLHYHSLWLLSLRYVHHAARRHAAPLVLSPRGMMTPWAWSHHRARKWLAGLTVHPGALPAVTGWHATSPEEAEDIRRLGFTQPVCIAPNGVDLPGSAALEAARAHWLAALPSLSGRRVALFYSRLHRKKRVRELIDLWLAAPRGDWVLLVVGVPEDYSAADLTQQVAARGGSASVIVADGTGQPPPYAVASLFLLPSHSENFGLVIAEALAAGVPALVTDTTPWQGLAREGAGDCVPWEAYPAALARMLAADEATLRTRAQQGRAWVARDFTWDRAAALLQQFYRHLRAS